MKFTPWFPSEIKPVHVGVYLVKFAEPVDEKSPEGFAHWDGRDWGWLKTTISAAYNDRNTYASDQNKTWRGLAEKTD